MTFEQYSKEFEKAAIKSGLDLSYILKCLDYAEPLFENNVPVIYNLSHLSSLLGYNKQYIIHSLVYKKNFYRQYGILKKNKSGIRIINEPLPSLKEIQRWILENILYKIDSHKHSTAYTPKSSTLKNASLHTKKRVVINLDLVDFFNQFTESQILVFFSNIGYSNIISKVLAGLCCYDNILPQGGVASAYLSNLLFRELDKAICDWSVLNRINYSRYADDMTFSSSKNIDLNFLLQSIQEILQNTTFKINREKTKIYRFNERQLVTGLVVNSYPQPSKEYRKKIRQEIHYLQLNGLEKHLNNISNKRKNYLHYLLGKVNYVLKFKPENKAFKQYKFILQNEIEKQT